MKEFKKGFLNGVKLLVLLGLIIGLTGCEDPNVEKPATIIGTWENEMPGYSYGGVDYPAYTEQYIITDTTLTYQNVAEDRTVTVQYAGTIEGDILENAEHGYIILKITDGGQYGKTVGRHYANHWKGLTTNSIQLSSAYKSDGETETDSLEEAISTFTVDNGYFGFYGDYTK